MKTNTGNETKTPPIYSVRDFMGLAHTVPQGGNYHYKKCEFIA